MEEQNVRPRQTALKEVSLSEKLLQNFYATTTNLNPIVFFLDFWNWSFFLVFWNWGFL